MSTFEICICVVLIPMVVLQGLTVSEILEISTHLDELAKDPTKESK